MTSNGSAYFWVKVENGQLTAVRVCGNRTVDTGGCMRPWGHYGKHLDQNGYEWETTRDATT